MKCEECKFWKMYNKKEGFGECRRFPPIETRDGFGTEYRLHPIWPETNSDNWCGEFSKQGD